jgi:hypothetical protein
MWGVDGTIRRVRFSISGAAVAEDLSTGSGADPVSCWLAVEYGALKELLP